MKRAAIAIACAVLLMPLAVRAEAPLAAARVGSDASITLPLPDDIVAAPIDDDADVIVSVSRTNGQAVITFTPTLPGTFDLRDYLRGPGGAPAAIDHPLIVTATSTLPPGNDLALKPIQPASPPKLGGYKAIATAIFAIWALMLIPLIFWKRPKKAPIPRAITIETPPPTLEEQLRALVQRFRDGDPSVADKTRLEALLLNQLREQFAMTDLTMADALNRLRHSPQAGPTIEGIERSFYVREPDAFDLTHVDVLLAQVGSSEKGRA